MTNVYEPPFGFDDLPLSAVAAQSLIVQVRLAKWLAATFPLNLARLRHRNFGGQSKLDYARYISFIARPEKSLPILTWILLNICGYRATRN